MIDKMKMGDRIRELREKRGYKTQYALYMAMGGLKYKPSIEKWESGKNIPNGESLIELCNVLKCDPAYILMVSDTPNQSGNIRADKIGISENCISRIASYTDQEKTILQDLIDNGDTDFLKSILDALIEYGESCIPDTGIFLQKWFTERDNPDIYKELVRISDRQRDTIFQNSTLQKFKPALDFIADKYKVQGGLIKAIMQGAKEAAKQNKKKKPVSKTTKKTTAKTPTGKAKRKRV